jgi:hypothetical protein
MTLPCDGCRFCPTTYVSGVVVVGDGRGAPHWDGDCGRGYEVSTTWVWNEDHERVIYLFRLPFWTVCSDRDEPYDGPRVSRYNRLPVI